MALSDTKIRSLSAKERAYQVADSGGLVIEVLPTGRKVWRLRYRFNGKPQKATLGEYPAFTLAEARLWREECRAMIAHGTSPAQKKQQEKAKQKEPTTVEAFSTCQRRFKTNTLRKHWACNHQKALLSGYRSFWLSSADDVWKMKLSNVENGCQWRKMSIIN